MNLDAPSHGVDLSLQCLGCSQTQAAQQMPILSKLENPRNILNKKALQVGGIVDALR